MDSAFLFRAALDAPGIYDTFFGGLFAALGLPMMAQAALLFFFPLALFAAYSDNIAPRKVYALTARGSALACFSLLTFFLVQPWDELFVNLRHAKHFAEIGLFSFNRQ